MTHPGSVHDEGQGLDPDAARESRRRALLARWAKGVRLLPAELAEIADLVSEPVEVPPDPAAVEPGAAVLPGQYALRAADYAEIFGRSARVVKGWITAGRRAAGGPDLPPLDSPEEMVAWWKRVTRNKPPETFYRFSRGGGGREGERPREAGGREVAVLNLPAGVGFTAELGRLRDRVQRLAATLNAAEEGGSPIAIGDAEEKYHRALDQLRTYERDAPKIQTASGDGVSRADVERVLREKGNALKQRLMRLQVRIDSELMAAPSPEERVQISAREIERIFREAALAGFAAEPGFELEAAA